MISRKEKYQVKHKWKAILLIGVLLLSFLAIGNVGVAFAGDDINSLLTNWFNQKGAQSVSTIEQAIQSEKEVQKQRLKEELQLKISESAKQLDQFTEEEKQNKVQSIKEYADQLISNMKIDNSEQKQQITAKMDAVIQKAKDDLNQVGSQSLPTPTEPNIAK